MIYVKTGEDKINTMVKALASRYLDSFSPDIAVVNENEAFPQAVKCLIVIYSGISYLSGQLHQDYVSKFGDKYISLSSPVSVRQLETALRKLSQRDTSSPRQAETVIFNKENRTLTKNDKSVTLTEKEAELYLILRENKGKMVSREQLRSRLWQDTNGTNAPDVYISYLRRKLRKVLGEGSLVNVRGCGYMLKEE